MEIANEFLTFERTSDVEVLSSFSCGVRKIDRLIHTKAEYEGLRVCISDPIYEMFIVFHNEKCVAVFVWHTTVADTDQGPVPAKEIDLVAVDKNLQRQGIGRKILDSMEENARANSYGFLLVGAYYDNRHSAIGFYEKCGFEPNGKKKAHILPMIKRLAGED